MSSAGSNTIAALSGGSDADASGTTSDVEAIGPSAADQPARGSTVPPRSVLLLTTNATFANRIGDAFRGKREISLQVVPLPSEVTSVHRLACDCAARVLVIDAALFERGRIVPQVGPPIPVKSFQLLLLFEKVDRCAVQLSLQTRAHGCMGYDIAPEHFLQAADVVANGEFWFPRWMVETFYDIALSALSPRSETETTSPKPDVTERLTQRELEVMGFVRHGLTNKEIARELCISHSTVKKHVHSAMQKLGFAHRRQSV